MESREIKIQIVKDNTGDITFFLIIDMSEHYSMTSPDAAGIEVAKQLRKIAEEM